MFFLTRLSGFSSILTMNRLDKGIERM